MTDASFTIGLEEEYFLVDLETRDLVSDPPEGLLAECQEVLGDHVTTEFMRCQIEVGTPVCHSAQEARAELGKLRHSIAECAGRHGMAPIAASTHPFAEWDKQQSTDKDRYQEIARDMQVVARRLLIGGMHVHVAIEDEPLRFDLFAQLPYFLPHLLALSTSSPFWRGQNTGLASYRLSIFNELPRTGLPASFAGPDEYHRTVAALIKAGEIEDASMIWWDLRPSSRFPTLEMRITDICTRVEDAVAIASLYRCITRMLYRLRRDNQRWRAYSSFLINENRWLAQRFGCTGSLIDFGKGEPIPFTDLIDEAVELVADDIAHFDCAAEIERVRVIAAKGTSSQRQVAAYDEARAQGADDREALRAVVDHLITETRIGTAPDS